MIDPSTITDNIIAGTDTHVARGRPMRPSVLFITVCEHAIPRKISNSFKAPLDSNGGLEHTQYQAQPAAATPYISFSYAGKPCEDWSGPNQQ